MDARDHVFEGRPLTVEEFERLPEEDAYRVELVRGTLVREPRPAALHGWVQLELASQLREHVKRHRLGHVFTDIGVTLSIEPATVRGPDIAFASVERLPSGPPARGFLGFAPDLCAEIVSPSNQAGEIREKVLDYLDAGTRLVWVLHPGERTVTVYRPGGDVRVLAEADELEGGSVLPGFRLRVAELFFR